tara:strand:- start:1998 stop:2186 length:189 start_codon:yes stop_codon:yes gene_type:complete
MGENNKEKKFLKISTTTFRNIMNELVDDYDRQNISTILITRDNVFPFLVDKLKERGLADEKV